MLYMQTLKPVSYNIFLMIEIPQTEGVSYMKSAKIDINPPLLKGKNDICNAAMISSMRAE